MTFDIQSHFNCSRIEGSLSFIANWQVMTPAKKVTTCLLRLRIWKPSELAVEKSFISNVT